MLSERKCPICGTVFVPDAPRQKYCSLSCRRAGAAAVRSKWIQKTGHREKDRLRHRERREQIKQDKIKQSQELKEQERRRIASCLEKSREDFNRRCEDGDIHALMLREKASRGNTTKRYWELFAAVEMRDAETSENITDTTVNGYSIYSDHFADDVMKSIQQGGHIEIKRIRRKQP